MRARTATPEDGSAASSLVPDVTDSGPPGRGWSDRHRTINGNAMHQPSQRQLVIADREMLHHAVVPHQQVANPPAMAVAELLAWNHFGKLLNQRQALGVRHAADADAFALAHIDRLAAGHWVGANHRVFDVRQILDSVG